MGVRPGFTLRKFVHLEADFPVRQFARWLGSSQVHIALFVKH